MAPRYERVPTADDDDSPSPQTQTAEKTSLAPRSRKVRLFILSLVVVVLLGAVYRFWFGDAKSDSDRGGLPSDDSKQDDTIGGGEGTKGPTKPNMPNGKLSVG